MLAAGTSTYDIYIVPIVIFFTYTVRKICLWCAGCDLSTENGTRSCCQMSWVLWPSSRISGGSDRIGLVEIGLPGWRARVLACAIYASTPYRLFAIELS